MISISWACVHVFKWHFIKTTQRVCHYINIVRFEVHTKTLRATWTARQSKQQRICKNTIPNEKKEDSISRNELRHSFVHIFFPSSSSWTSSKSQAFLYFSFKVNHWMMRWLLFLITMRMNWTSFAVSSSMAGQQHNAPRIKCDKKKDVMKLNYHIFHSTLMVLNRDCRWIYV